MNRTVLLVDDDVNARIVAETLLCLRGMRVRCAADGSEACEIVSRGDIGVVVTELSLPGMNGFEVLRRIRGRFASPRVVSQPRIIVMTDRQEADVERFVLRLGADAFLRKPVAWGEFLSTIEGWVGSVAPEAA